MRKKGAEIRKKGEKKCIKMKNLTKWMKLFIYQHFSRIEVIRALCCNEPTLGGCDAW